MKKLSNWFNDRILFIGIIILLVFIPLYPKFPLFNVPRTYVAIRFEDFLVAFLVGIFVLKMIKERTKVFHERLPRLFLAYFLIGGLSTLSALALTKNVFPNLIFLHWARHIEYMLLFFIAAHSVKKYENVKDAVMVIFITTVGVIIYGLGQKFLGFPVVSTMNEEFSKGMLLTLTEWARINSTFAGHYDLAAYLVLVLAIIIGGILSFQHPRKKIIIAVLWVFVFYLLILTAAQMSFLAYILTIPFILFFARKFRWIIPIMAISILGTFASRDLTDRYAATIRINRDLILQEAERRQSEYLANLNKTTSPVIPIPTPTAIVPVIIKNGQLSKLKNIPTPSIITPSPINNIGPKKYMTYESTASADITEVTAYRSITIRLNVEWPRSIRAFTKNPLLGTGYSSLGLATDNDYLRVLGETGILGFLAIFLIFFELGKQVFLYLKTTKSCPEKYMVIGFTGAVFGFLINATFIDVFESSKVAYTFWIIVGLLAGLMKLTPVKTEKQI